MMAKQNFISEDWMVAWQRIRVMTRKEVQQLLRDGILMGFVLYAFTGDIFVAGSGMKMELSNAKMIVLDADQSPVSRELISRFHGPEFNVIGSANSPEHALQLLDHGKAMILIDIPSGFQDDLIKGRQASIQLQTDSSNSVLGTWANSYAAQIIGGFALEQSLGALGIGGDGSGPMPVPMVDDRHRVWFNPNSVDKWFIPVVEMMTMVTMLSVMLPAAAMVREKERGTIEQLLVSPLTPMQILFPKVISMTIVIMIGITLALFVVLRPAFDLPIRGNLFLFYFLSAIYVFTMSGVGMALSTVVNNMAQVGMMVILFLAPMLMLSGTFVPYEGMAPAIRWIMFVSPLHYYVEITLGILLRGAGIDILWPNIIPMTGIGAVVFTLSLLRFRRQFN